MTISQRNKIKNKIKDLVLLLILSYKELPKDKGDERLAVRMSNRFIKIVEGKK